MMGSMGTKIITVRVGIEGKQQDFTVHETLVRQASPFFENALSHEWTESQSRIVNLPTMRAEDFHLYVQCIYTGRLYARPSDRKTPFEANHAEFKRLANAYVLGDYLQDTAFRDTIIDAILECAVEGPLSIMYSGCASTLYLETQEGCPLRKLLIDITVWLQRKDVLEILEETGVPQPVDFLRGVIIGLHDRFQGANRETDKNDGIAHFNAIRGTCHYHCHGEEKCYKERAQR
jgi:hypothetical protein